MMHGRDADAEVDLVRRDRYGLLRLAYGYKFPTSSLSKHFAFNMSITHSPMLIAQPPRMEEFAKGRELMSLLLVRCSCPQKASLGDYSKRSSQPCR